MKNSYSIIALFIVFAMGSCASGQDSFPAVVNVKQSAGMKRVKGTRYFVTVPDAYKPLEKLVRYQKDNETYFQVFETPNTNFQRGVEKLSRKSLESQGGKVDVYKRINYNGFEGLYIEGPSVEGDAIKMMLVFGDSSFVTMVIGVCQVSDKASREELRKIFRSSCYDTSYHLNPLELVNFTLDAKITDFKLAQRAGNLFYYSQGGRISQYILDCPYYQVIPSEAGSFEKAKGMIEGVMGEMAKRGITISNTRQEELTIDGLRAYEVITDAKDENNRTGIQYYLVLYKESASSAVFFNGVDCTGGTYLDKLKATAKSIRF